MNKTLQTEIASFEDVEKATFDNSMNIDITPDKPEPDELKSDEPESDLYPNMPLEIIELVNENMDEIYNDGTLDKILKKYEKQPGEFWRLAKLYEIPKM